MNKATTSRRFLALFSALALAACGDLAPAVGADGGGSDASADGL